MAAVVEFKRFWGALLSVLLKCIAALGITTPATRTVAAPVRTPVAGGTHAETAAAAVPTPRGQAVPRIPAPRGCQPVRGGRGRTLPPTMKQRICAEAHGSSPSARSLRTADGDLTVEESAAGMALAQAAASPAASSYDALGATDGYDRPAPAAGSSGRSASTGTYDNLTASMPAHRAATAPAHSTTGTPAHPAAPAQPAATTPARTAGTAPVLAGASH